jgi:hypothetical protein
MHVQMIAVAKFQQIFIDIQLSFKADSQLSTSWKAFLRLLHHPAMLAQLFAALNASSARDHDLDGFRKMAYIFLLLVILKR